MDTHDFIRAPGVESGRGQEAANASNSRSASDSTTVESSEFPRTVIRGESLPTPHTPTPTQVALTDWLNITFPFPEGSNGIGPMLSHLASYLGDTLGGLKSLNKGLHGYHESFAFDNGGALFACGGQNGTGFISIPGKGCALIERWDLLAHVFENELQGRITRWDGAVDDFEGRYSVDLALEWYLSGRFGTGGNKPKMKQAGNWAQPDGSGRTLYIGNRVNGKLLRVYEKGKQLGDKLSPWTRWEVQLNNRDRIIPFDVLLNPRPRIAGAYKCMGWVCEEASRIRTTQKTGEISYDHLTDCARTAYGPLLNVMMAVEGSAEAVISKLTRAGVPKRLDLPHLDLKAIARDR